MTSIVKKICQSETFIRMLEEKLSEDINGKDGSVIDYNAGQVDGHVVGYEIVSDIIFKSSSVEDFTVKLELEFTGNATINYQRVGIDEEYDNKTLQGLGNARISVAVPSELLMIEDFENIIENLEIEVEESSAYLTEKEERAVDEEEEKFNEYMNRRSILELLSVEVLIDKTILLEDKVTFLEDKIMNLEKQISDKDTPS